MILQLKGLQRRLLCLEVLRLSLRRSERPIESVQRRVDSRLRTLNSCGRGRIEAGIELLELLRQSLKGVRKSFLLINKIAEVREQILVGLPDSGATAGRILNRLLKLLSEVPNGGGLLLKLLQLTGEHLWVEDDLSAASKLRARWRWLSKQTYRRGHDREELWRAFCAIH